MRSPSKGEKEGYKFSLSPTSRCSCVYDHDDENQLVVQDKKWMLLVSYKKKMRRVDTQVGCGQASMTKKCCMQGEGGHRINE